MKIILSMLAGLLFISCNEGGVKIEEVPDHLRKFVVEVSGDNLMQDTDGPFVYSTTTYIDLKANNKGMVNDYKSVVEWTRIPVPTWVANAVRHKSGEELEFCVEYGRWQKSRKITESKQVDMTVCETAVRETRQSHVVNDVFLSTWLYNRMNK